MLNSEEVGMRVGAIVGSDDETKTLQIFGFGTYEGDKVPPEDVITFLGMPYPKGTPDALKANPQIKLDSGEMVYGAECWWGPEAEIKREVEAHRTSGWTIQTITVASYREAGKQIQSR